MVRSVSLALFAVLLATPSFAQHESKEQKPAGDKVIVKEIRPDGGKVLDASGLTDNLARIQEMLRSFAKLDIEGEELQIHTGRLPTLGVDYQAFESLEEGIVQFQGVAAIKLRTPRNLRFGEVAVPMGNVAPDYPGLYSLWLKKTTDDKWTLIFNHEADAWGTMYEPAANAGEIRLSHSLEKDVKLPLGVSIEDGSDGKVLQFAWGEHRWSTPFTIQN